MICVVYVDDLIFWSKDIPQINRVVMELRKLGVDLEQKTMRLVSLELPWIVRPLQVYLK